MREIANEEKKRLEETRKKKGRGGIESERKGGYN